MLVTYYNQRNIKDINAIINYNSNSKQSTNNFRVKEYMPPQTPLNNDSVSFGRLKLPYINLHDVPCAYCNKPMISLEQFNAIRWPIEKKNLVAYHKKLIHTLEPFEPYMRETEASVFKGLKELNSRHPKKTFQQLLEILRPKHLQLLEDEQIIILDGINEMLDFLPPKLQQTPSYSPEVIESVRELINATKLIVQHPESQKHFLRKVFFSKLNLLIKEHPQNTLLKVIKKRANSLPTSRDSKSAFIVKYSGKVPISKKEPQKGLQYKSSKGIAVNLISSARESTDHFHATDNGGANNLCNALGACEHCNTDIKGNTSLNQFIKIFGIVDNIKLHFKYLIKHVANIEDGVNYIKNLAKNINRRSGNIIQIDTSGLDVPKSI